MSTKTTDKATRTITELFNTARPEIKLRIVTHHDKRSRGLYTRVSRVEVTKYGHREKFSMRGIDTCPVRAVLVPVDRYSLTALENAHANFISNNVAGMGQFSALKEWAERA